MKKLFIIICCSLFIICAFFILRHQIPRRGLPNNLGEGHTIQKHLQTFHSIEKEQSFVILVLGENASESYEKQLRSIFNQTYDDYRIIYLDNGSVDQTGQKVMTLCEEENKQDKLTLIRYDEKKAQMQIIYETIHSLNGQEIVVYLEGHDWFSHENVLDHLNCAYAHPDVWLTYSRVIHHPDYQKIEGRSYSDEFLKEKKFRKTGDLPWPSLISFPVAYFKEIRLADFLFNGSFIEEKAPIAFLYPLFEMGPEHVLFMDEVMLIKNNVQIFEDHKEHLHHLMAVEAHLRSLEPYSNLTTFHSQSSSGIFHRKKGDVLIFSEDSPLHLYACLESLYLKVRDINQIYVIYESHDHEFERAYLNLKNEFPSVQFLDVCNYPGNDFKSLVNKTLSNKRYGSHYILITDDHYLFDQKVKLYDCIKALEKVHGDHFFLTIDEKALDGTLPEAIQLEEGMYAWQMGDERHKQSPYMCICRKAFLEGDFLIHQLEDLSAFKELWKKQLSPHTVALFYEEKKGALLKLEQEENLTQKKDWGKKFIEGYKIDLPSVFCEMNELQKGDYPLIKRDKRKAGFK